MVDLFLLNTLSIEVGLWLKLKRCGRYLSVKDSDWCPVSWGVKLRIKLSLDTLAGSATAREAEPQGQWTAVEGKVGYLYQDNRQVCFATFMYLTSTEYDSIETVQTSTDTT